MAFAERIIYGLGADDYPSAAQGGRYCPSKCDYKPISAEYLDEGQCIYCKTYPPKEEAENTAFGTQFEESNKEEKNNLVMTVKLSADMIIIDGVVKYLKGLGAEVIEIVSEEEDE